VQVQQKNSLKAKAENLSDTCIGRSFNVNALTLKNLPARQPTSTMPPVVLFGPAPSMREMSKNGPFIQLTFPNTGNLLGNLMFAYRPHLGGTRSSSNNAVFINAEKERLAFRFITVNELLNEPGLKTIYVNRPNGDFYAFCLLFFSPEECITGYKRMKSNLWEVDRTVLVGTSKLMLDTIENETRVTLKPQEISQVQARALSPAAGPYEQTEPTVSVSLSNATTTVLSKNVETINDPVVVSGDKGISF
jgi:hypothetical protein